MLITKGVALITGSAQGIGRGIALRLARDGFDIALNDVSSKRDRLGAVADEIDKIGRKPILVPADVTLEEEVKGMVQKAVEELGGLDVMVANAGVQTSMSLISSTKLDAWEHAMAVNARGPFLCYKHAAKHMIKQGRGGRILGASSVAGKMGYPLGAPYCASKWAIRGLTQTAALELGRYGITVNSYAPGIIETPMVDNFRNAPAPAGVDIEYLEWIGHATTKMRPIKTDGHPEDIANLVSYLASKEAHLITGQCIAVDGGISMS